MDNPVQELPQGSPEVSRPGKRPVARWVQVYIPKELADDLKPVADQNNMSISDIIALFAVEGGLSFQAKMDMHNAMEQVGHARCVTCGTQVKRAPEITDAVSEREAKTLDVEEQAGDGQEVGS